LAPFWKTLLLYVFGFSLLGVVIYTKWDGNPATDPPTPGLSDVLDKPIDWTPLFIATGLCCAALFTSFVRWWTLVRAQDLPFSLYNAVRLGLVGYYLSTFLPGSIGGDLIKAYAISKEQTRRAVAVSTVLIDRGVGLWALFWMVSIIGSILWLTGDPLLVNNVVLMGLVRFCVIIVSFTVFVWVALGFLPQRRADRFARRLEWFPKVGHALAEFWRAVWMYRKRPGAILLALILSLITHTGWVLMFHFSAQVFASTFPPNAIGTFAEHLLIVPAGMTGQAFIPTPGGVGGAEAFYGYLYFQFLGRLAAVGVLACLTMRLITWIVGFAGYIVYIRMRAKLPTPVEVAPAQTADALPGA